MKIFGLTGGIATGKSTVSNIFENDLNIPVIDADHLARKAVEPNSLGLTEIVKAYGKDILLSNGTLDRKKLAKMVFNHDKEIKKLNDIIHPLVDQMFLELVKEYNCQGEKMVIYDCPLLIEGNLIDRVDEIILVVVDETTQLKRLMLRDKIEKKEALKKINIQIPIKDKIKYAHYIIYNDGNQEQLKKGVFSLGNVIS